MPLNTIKEFSVSNLPPEGFMVGSAGDEIVIMRFHQRITRDQALNLAAWLVAIADPGKTKFDEYLTAVRNT